MVLMQSDATTERPVTARDGVRAAWFAYCVLALLLLAVVDLLWAGIVIVGAAALATVPPVAADSEPHGRQDRRHRGRGTLRRSGGFFLGSRSGHHDRQRARAVPVLATVGDAARRGRAGGVPGVGARPGPAEPGHRPAPVAGHRGDGAGPGGGAVRRDHGRLLDAGCRAVGSAARDVPCRGAVRGRVLPRVRPAVSRPASGPVAAVAGAAVLYAAYHVGYGMGLDEMWFLLGLGVLYAVIYRLTTNILILWPLLTPLGAFFNNLDNGTSLPGVAPVRRRRDADARRALARPPSDPPSRHPPGLRLVAPWPRCATPPAESVPVPRRRGRSRPGLPPSPALPTPQGPAHRSDHRHPRRAGMPPPWRRGPTPSCEVTSHRPPRSCSSWSPPRSACSSWPSCSWWPDSSPHPRSSARGTRRFVVDRLVRLGCPFALYVLVVQPVLTYALEHRLGVRPGPSGRSTGAPRAAWTPARCGSSGCSSSSPSGTPPGGPPGCAGSAVGSRPAQLGRSPRGP